MAVLAIMTPIILETLSQSLGTSFRQGFIDCEQSLFFFRFSESNAHTRERQSRETRETRAAARRRKKRDCPFSQSQ